MLDASRYQKYCYNNEPEYVKDVNCYKNTYSVKVIRNYIARLRPEKKILDVGCADGELLANSTQQHQIYGVDIAPKLLTLAHEKGLQTKIADLEKAIPYPDSYFDLLVVHHVLEHVINTDILLSECNRVLKKNGQLFLSIPNVATIISLFLLFFNLPPYQSARYRSLHVRDFTLKTAIHALTSNGFKVVINYGGQFLISAGFSLFSFITRLFPLSGIDITLLAQKIKTVEYDKSTYNFGSMNLRKLLGNQITSFALSVKQCHCDPDLVGRSNPVGVL